MDDLGLEPLTNSRTFILPELWLFEDDVIIDAVFADNLSNVGTRAGSKFV